MQDSDRIRTADQIPRGVVAVVPRRDRLLVIRRSQTVVAPGAYCFPGGGVHGEESESAAVIREMQEELHIHAIPRRCLWRSVTPWNVALAWWLAEISADAVPRPNPDEVAEYHWLTPVEIRSLAGLLESNHHFLDAWSLAEFVLRLE